MESGHMEWRRPKQFEGKWFIIPFEALQGLTLRSQRHLPIGQVQVMFYLPSGHGHLP